MRFNLLHPSNMPLILNVPYTEKDLAKSKGAFWSPQLKTWYLPDERYDLLSAVERWIPENGFNIILPGEIILAHAIRNCWNCGRANTVTAIGANSFYLKDGEGSSWEEIGFFTLFEGITLISINLKTFLQNYYPDMRLAYSKTAEGYYWSNHCAACKKIQGDWFLFSEPGGAFSPISPEKAAEITLKSFTFQSSPMINGGFIMGDTMEFIIDYAKWETPIN